MQNKIDIVIAWVDGNDPAHKIKRQKYLNSQQSLSSVEDTRFASNDEIYYNIASILKYVPYVGKIFIVTDQQAPLALSAFQDQGLCSKDQIQVIDHTSLFSGYEQCLPTFNSLSIEAMLWNIPNISDYFLYLNDDFFFNAPSAIEDFLINDRIKIYGHWRSNFTLKMKYQYRSWLKKQFQKEPKSKYTIAQMLSADILGFNKYYEIHHRPHILSKQLLEKYFEDHAEILYNQIQYKFRDFDQYLPVGLNNHLAIQQDKAILEGDIQIAYLKNSQGIDSFCKQLVNTDFKFGCIQSLDQLNDTNRLKIVEGLKYKFSDYLPNILKSQILS
ncbi:Stealth CR1 domain-containing protein [Acinetobacter indicus]|uniref:Stealth CR1 domain-containing protein n=1 Tax=Acinetobacter indicus TaxID=756892 RepID=UPI0032B5EC72